MDPNQCRMARAGLGISADKLAEQAGKATDTVRRFERGEGAQMSTVAALKAALESHGVTFLSDDGDGPGVRVRVPR